MTLKYIEVPSKDARYAYTTGRVRALELCLLEEVDLMRMRQSAKIGEVLRILKKNYPYSESMKDIEKEDEFERGLDRELKRTYQEIRYFCPEPDLIDLFWLDNDFHNMKVLLKAHFKKRVISGNSLSLRPPLSEAGTLDLTLLEEFISKEDFSGLAPRVRDIFEEIFSLTTNSYSARFIDDFLDRRFFQWVILEMKKYPDPFLTRLIQLQIDSFNIKAFFRLKLFWEGKVSPEQVFAEGGTISKQQLLRTISYPLETLEEELGSTDYGHAVRLALQEQEKGNSLFSLDKFFDQYILQHTYCGFYITLGREPLVNYIYVKKQEIKHLREILGSRSVK